MRVLLTVAIASALGMSALAQPCRSQTSYAFARVANNANLSLQSRRNFGSGYYEPASNRTYVTWNGPAMDVYINAYNHDAQNWGQAVKVADWDDTETNAYHDYGVLQKLPDGRLGVFIFDHTRSATLLRSANPNSLGGPWTRQVISTDRNTYPMPVVVGATTYLFYSKNDNISGTAAYRTFRMIRSNDSGATWSGAATVIDSGRTADNFNEVYAQGVSVGNGRIWITWTMAGGADHDASSRNLYLGYFNTADGNMYTVRDQNSGPVIDGAELANFLIRSSPPEASTDYWRSHPITNSTAFQADDGTVHVAFGETASSDDIKRIIYGHFNGSSWTFRTVETGTARFMDMYKAGPNDFEVMYTTEDWLQIKARRTVTAGTTFSSLYTLATNFGTSVANRIVYANFIENRRDIDMVGGTTFTGASVGQNYGGIYPMISVER